MIVIHFLLRISLYEIEYKLEKVPPYGRHFASSWGGLLPSAATVGPFGLNSGALLAKAKKMSKIFSEFFFLDFILFGKFLSGIFLRQIFFWKFFFRKFICGTFVFARKFFHEIFFMKFFFLTFSFGNFFFRKIFFRTILSG